MNAGYELHYYKKSIRSIRLEAINTLRIITLAAIVLKTSAFLALLETSGANKLTWSNMSFKLSIVHLAFASLVFSFGYLLADNKQVKFNIIFNIIYSVMLILDLWYFRVNRDFYGLKNIFFRGTFNTFNQSLIKPEFIDIIFAADIVLLIIWTTFIGIRSNRQKSYAKFRLVASLSVISIVVSFILVDIGEIAGWDKKLFKAAWSPLMSVRAPGPLGYHGFEAFRTITKAANIKSNKEKQEIKTWLSDNNEKLPDNEYKAILKGKNVIFLQLEAFENFIINKEANGKEITPFLNKLTREGLYFNNIHEQNNAGNSIDCDLMVNTSILPLGSSITALNYGEVVYSKSFSRLLKSEGYTTVASHPEDKAEFNWTELHKNGFGTDILWDINEYNYEETVGYGLSDRSFLTQLADKIKTLPQPFYLNAPTLSSHGPFNIQQKYRELNLPKKIDESYLGGYFESAHYTDKQVEMFINKLDEQGILDNTVVVIYGDHAGVHKYYNEEIKDLSFEGDWWKEYDHEIPLIMYSKGITPKIFEAVGGHIDIMPTTAYLLGVGDSKYRSIVMGRVLVNTNRNATVIKGNVIKGQVQTNEEKEHLLKSYDIGSEIIKNRYFQKE
jgi:phosphoglycerol transferase MdoB-like AlkP superfamily enzyme